ncbi:ABC transporter ATP-binding protein [Natronosporangium hydrolyticum]|uniref:ABC transporter ATP-binding protein n=1 Tax=Natronosporangium hydrolyticum TaxID=2811111 RepID=A0A895YNG2_9ACTN|nr:ABC transporter ATP-binding protein [Natronosporangium hydrolyticum]QSB15660.1 ABC transporter ATP-binding protein [Natronosporangium hydrolyticum]
MLLEIDNLVKVYRRGVRANDGISLGVEAGEVLGLLGHNGAGKTTLLNQVVGLARPTSGRIRIDGTDPVTDPASARRLCSLQPQAHAPLNGVTPRQAIEIMARIRGASRKRARQRADELLTALDLSAWANTVGERLSGGVRRLTAFCMAAAEPGRVVMFDEPTNDVDPVRRRLLWQQVTALAEQGCAVVLVTHNVVEAERAVQRLVVLDRGRVVAQGTPAQLRGDRAARFRLEVLAVDDQAAGALAAEYVGAAPAVVSGRRVVTPIRADDAAGALAWAQQQQAVGRVDEFSVSPVSLEDIYISLVGAEGGAEEERDRAELAA